MAKKAAEKVECVKCGKPISSERLKYLPSTVWCVKCSEEKPRDDADNICAQPAVEGRNGFANGGD